MSHGSGGTFWSGTDDKTIGILGGDGFMVSMVTNKKRDKLFRLGMKKPIRIDVNKLDWAIAYLPDEELEKACKAEFDEKVTEYKTNFNNLGSGNYWPGGGPQRFRNGRWENAGGSASGSLGLGIGGGGSNLPDVLDPTADDGDVLEVEPHYLILQESNYDDAELDKMLSEGKITEEQHGVALAELIDWGMANERS